MPAGVGYGEKAGKKKVNKAGIMRQLGNKAKVTKGMHERALNAAFEMARRKKKR